MTFVLRQEKHNKFKIERKKNSPQQRYGNMMMRDL